MTTVPPKDDWLRAICRDPGVGSAHFRVAYALAAEITDAGVFKGRLIEIAAMSGMTPHSVRSALFRLAERRFGTVKIERQWIVFRVCSELPRRELPRREKAAA